MKSKKLLIWSLICIFAAAVFAQLALAPIAWHRYFKQASFILAVILLIVGLILLYKFSAPKIKKLLKSSIGPIFKRLSQRAKSLNKRIKKFFGTSHTKYTLSGEDERSFIRYNEDNRKRNVRKHVKLPRYGTLAENSERIRFIYIKFILLNIKSGFKYKSTHTPAEISKLICTEDSQKKLVKLYENARYGYDMSSISDSDVKDMAKIVNLK